MLHLVQHVAILSGNLGGTLAHFDTEQKEANLQVRTPRLQPLLSQCSRVMFPEMVYIYRQTTDLMRVRALIADGGRQHSMVGIAKIGRWFQRHAFPASGRLATWIAECQAH